MVIAFTCPHCGVEYRLPSGYGGRVARCKKCSKRLRVPMPAGSGASVPAASAPQGEAVGLVPVPMDVSSPAELAGPKRGSREVGRRRKALLTLGVLLIIVFFVPEFSLDRDEDGEYVKVEHARLVRLTKSHVSTAAKFMLLQPVITGIAAIVVGCAVFSRIRGIILLALFGLPLVVMTASRSARQVLSLGASGLPDDIDAHLAILVIGALAMLVGSSARRYRPRWGHLYWIGLAGAGLLVVSQLIRSDNYRAAIPLAGMIKALTRYSAKSPGPAIVSGLRVLATVLLLIASILCVCNHPKAGTSAARSIGQGALKLCGWALILLLLADVGEAVKETFNSASVSSEMDAIMARMAFNAPKLVIWFAATLALVPAGLVDLIIGKPRGAEPGVAAPAAAPMQAVMPVVAEVNAQADPPVEGG